MLDPTKRSQETSHEYRVKRRRRRRFAELKKNLYWAMIILIIALVMGAVVGMSSQFFEKYFSSGPEEDISSSMPKDMSKKLKGLDIDKLLREKERLKR